MAQPTSTRKPNNDSYDDLTVISGIGEARQTWIREAFAVRTYADLAALSVDEIAARLKQDHKVVSAEAIEAWIAQANQLARQPEAQEKWKVFATFVVEFEDDGEGIYRTRVHHMEHDQTRQWAGSEPHNVSDWISAQLGLKLQEQTEIVSPAIPTVQIQEAPPQTLETTMPGALPEVAPETTHNRLQELIAKVSAWETHQQPTPATPAAVTVNPKLQQVVGKVRQLTGVPTSPFPQSTSNLELTGPPAEGQQSLYSEKLQRLIGKMHELEA